MINPPADATPKQTKCAFTGCRKMAEPKRSYCPDHWSGSWITEKDLERAYGAFWRLKSR